METGQRRNQGLFWGGAAAVILLLASLIVVYSPRPQQTPSSAPLASPVPAADTLESARETLRKGADLNSCRAAVAQLNLHLRKHPAEKPAPLTPEERDLLRQQFDLTAAELAEVEGNDFTPLDAHHLETCLLLRDAARSLNAADLPPLDRARVGFAWVMRQVRLRDNDADLLPVQFVLRRGWGTSRDRAVVFLALLDQLGIDGCMVAYGGDKDGQSGPTYWIPGALVDKSIYLFDTRLGIPLPGAHGQGVATLAAVRSRADEVLAPLVKHHYDLSPEQAKRTEIHLVCGLSALAPRMRYLQGLLSSGEKVTLAVSTADLFKRFQEATTVPGMEGCPVRVWNPPADPNTPVRVLRNFLTPEEGGVRNQPIYVEQIPWEVLLKQLPDLPGELGRQLQRACAGLLLNFYSDPRELMLRGRLEEATSRLVANLDYLRQQREVINQEPNLAQLVAEWCDQVKSATLDYQRLQQAGASSGAKEAAKQQLDALWREDNRAFRLLLIRAIAEPAGSEVSYFLALCKQEQAERLQAKAQRAAATAPRSAIEAARGAWKTAAGWWDRFVQEYPSSPDVPSARFLQANALEALDNRAAATAILNNLCTTLTGLEKTACLYRADQQGKTRP